MINVLKERGGMFLCERVKGSQELRFVSIVRECNNIKRTCEIPSQIRIRVLTLLREGDAFVHGTSSVYTYACPACRLIMDYITHVINIRRWPLLRSQTRYVCLTDDRIRRLENIYHNTV